MKMGFVFFRQGPGDMSKSPEDELARLDWNEEEEEVEACVLLDGTEELTVPKDGQSDGRPLRSVPICSRNPDEPGVSHIDETRFSGSFLTVYRPVHKIVPPHGSPIQVFFIL